MWCKINFVLELHSKNISDVVRMLKLFWDDTTCVILHLCFFTLRYILLQVVMFYFYCWLLEASYQRTNKAVNPRVIYGLFCYYRRKCLQPSEVRELSSRRRETPGCDVCLLRLLWRTQLKKRIVGCWPWDVDVVPCRTEPLNCNS